MNIFATSSSLVLSCILRFSVECNAKFLLVVENISLAILVLWIPTFWASAAIALAIFLALAFYGTQVEYRNAKANVQELNPRSGTTETKDLSANINPTWHPKISPSGDGMCPVATLKFPLSPKDASLHSAHITEENEQEKARAIIAGQDEPKELHGKAILFPCHLRHRRLSPFKDNFSHSYLYCGIPVGLHASYSPILCVDMPEAQRSRRPFSKAWFNLRAQDHGIRGGIHMTMSQKLREFLLFEGADPGEWTYAYLLAVPCVNGQVDNPLGFWYLYTAAKDLTAIIPELNTSYGERRMWLVRNSLSKDSKSSRKRNSPYCFRGHFGKDIYVSPFMPPGGGYTIDTCDPCASESNQLDILVTLTKPEGGPTLVSRVTSSEPGLDVVAASMWEKLSFLVRWCYVPTCTVMTYRILSQAARIYLKAPRTFTRPEPGSTALGKQARVVERTLERYFRLILKDTIENHPAPISVTYITPGEHSQKSETFHSLGTPKPQDEEIIPSGTITPPWNRDIPELHPKIKLQVISPTFYSRFIHYPSLHAAFAAELLDDPRTCTLWSSDPSLFSTLFPPPSPSPSPPSSAQSKEIVYPPSSTRYHFTLLSLLRPSLIPPNFPTKTKYKPFSGLSSIDHWVLKHCTEEEIKEYRRAVLRVFIGEWIGGVNFGPLKLFSHDLEPFGLSRDAVVRIYDAIFKVVVIVGAVSAVRGLESGCDGWSMGLAGWAVAGVNIWALIKAVV